jgi:hypothetical protein
MVDTQRQPICVRDDRVPLLRGHSLAALRIDNGTDQFRAP